MRVPRVGAAAAALLIGLGLWLSSRGVPVSGVFAPDEIIAGDRLVFVKLRATPPAGFQLASDESAAATRSTLRLFEDAVELGPPHAVHDDIRAMGAGRFSHWDGHVLFSSSDGSDPRTNGRQYRFEATATPHYSAGWLGLLLMTLSAPTLVGVLRRSAFARLPPPVVQRWDHAVAPLVTAWRWSKENLLPGLAVSVVLLVVGTTASEIYLRRTVPFDTVNWPMRFDPEVGFRFEPQAEVRHTNHLDFWMRERTNAWGFLDREPPADSEAGVCTVTWIGDSFVEAAQVPIAEKAPTLLEQQAGARHPQWRVRARGFGVSGTGQLNELPLYDQFARPLTPAIAVLVVTSNDFANNSALLESARYGWDPDHLPRVFARRTPAGFVTTAIDPSWRSHLLAEAPTPPCRRCAWHQALLSESLVYGRVTSALGLRAPRALALLNPAATRDLVGDRVRQLAARPEYAGVFEGWDLKVDMDRVFYQEHLPPVFEDAVAFTGFAFDEFKRRAAEDGAHLVLLLASQISMGLERFGPAEQGRYAERIRRLAAARGIPVIDQFEAALDRGVDPSTLAFRYDRHWTAAAHALAADMVLGYVEQRPDLCARRPPTAG